MLGWPKKLLSLQTIAAQQVSLILENKMNTNEIAALFALIKKHGIEIGELSPLRIRWTLFIAFYW